MFVIYTRDPQFSVNRIEEGTDLYYQITEYTKEGRIEAKSLGKRFAHFFEEKEDEYGNTYYEYTTSIMFLD